jgi:hypothetical protein
MAGWIYWLLFIGDAAHPHIPFATCSAVPDGQSYTLLSTNYAG